jgi:L-ascorbate metabolism protein UlaG (beta-lactamase superfamily)
MTRPSIGHPGSDHFDGGRFHNVPNRRQHGLREFLRWILNRQQGPWRDWTDDAAGPPPPARVSGERLRVTFVNHATLLVQMDDLNILTDPIWSDRCSPVSFLGPRRRRPSGIRFEDLPPVDVVAISHNHYDHLDLPTLRRLASAGRPLFVTPLGNGALLRSHGLENVVELDWWEHLTVGSRRTVTAVPAQHFSGRGLFDRDRQLWGGFVFTTAAGSVYFAGDTGFGPHFAEVRKRLGAPRAALLPIGAFRPQWFMSPVHISPEEAIAAHDQLGARTSIAMHFGTFPLGDDGETEAPDRLRRETARRSLEENVLVLRFGEGRDLP